MAKKTAAKKSAGKKPVAKASPKETPAAVASLPPLPKIHPLVVSFVVFHVLAITLYALPSPATAAQKSGTIPNLVDQGLKYNLDVIKPQVGKYLYPTGTWQYWDMFAPDPAQTDVWCDAEVTYFDGTKTTFKYPHMKEMSIPDKFMHERHRKFYERVNQDQMRFYWMPFAQAIAYQMANDSNNPPVSVALTRHFQEWAKMHNTPNAPDPKYGSYRFFSYIVDQHKLFADKGWKLGVH